MLTMVETHKAVQADTVLVVLGLVALVLVVALDWEEQVVVAMDLDRRGLYHM